MKGRWLHEQFAAAARSAPESLALVSGDCNLSYAELDQLATTTAKRMLVAGVAKGDLVALCFTPGPEQIVCMLAAMRCGAAWTPLDPDWPQQRQADVLQQTQPRLIVCGDGLALPAAVGTAVHFSDLPAASPGELEDPQLTADDLCYVMFTSGSTGQPNGVLVTHGNVAGLLVNVREQLDIESTDNWSAMHSPAFGFSIWETWGALSTGGTLVLIPGSERGDPWAWDLRLRKQRVSVLSLTPSGLRQWLAAGCDKPPDCLRMVVLSGEPLGAAEVERWFRFCDASAAGSGPRLVNTYALTETAGRVAMTELQPQQPAALLGRATNDAELLLLDPQTHQPVADGETGELFVSGPTVARGYLDDPALTAARFVHLDPGDGCQRRCYRTGDLAVRQADGRLNFAGRDDAQIKLRGHRIEPADIESALQAHPDVEAAAVVAVDGSNSRQLHAFVVPASAGQDIEFWPSLGEYQVYDDLLYDFMSSDQVRVDSYRQAFAHAAPGKVVLDIGTGKDALLARLALQAGARHVYAVEVLPEAAAQAAALVAQLGLQDRITVICGDMDEVEIPEPVELCTQGIVGNIGSSDGIVPIWNRARRFFAPQATAVPSRCTTFIAPAALPGVLRTQAAFGPLAADYTRRVFASEGREFDVRLCVRNFPRAALLADAAVFEELDFSTALATDSSAETCFTVSETGWLDGYLLWTRLDHDGAESVDYLDHQQAWLPVWFPVGDEPLRVQRGDKLTLRWRCTTPDGQVFPDYRIETVRHDAAGDESLTYTSRHYQQDRNATSLHRSLLASLSEPDFQDGLNEASLRDWLAARLPEYMVPSGIDWLARLPLNSSRKLDRDALRRRAEQSRHAVAAAAAAGTESCSDPLEQGLAALWCDVLGLQSAGPGNDFFADGGDSISAVRLTTEVQRLLDDAVFLAGLFEAPTVRDYAQWLRIHHKPAVENWLQNQSEGAEHTASQEAAGTANDPLPLSAAQQSLFFLQQLYPDNTAANEQFLIRLQNVDIERLHAAWAALTRRHNILNVRIDDDMRQWPDSEVQRRLEEISDQLDLSVAVDAEAELRRLAGEEIRRPFDLAAGRLLRPVLVRLSSQQSVLLVTAHHIIADGLCVPLIRDELFALYEQQTLPHPARQFGEYVHSQRAQVQGAWLENEQAWWREHLAGVDPEPVPALRSQASSAGPEHRIPFVIDLATTKALRELARDQGVSVFVLLLALWRTWLARCFEREDFLLGSPVTQRNSADTEKMLGCLVNNLAFRNALDFDQGFATAVQNEHRQMLAALDHSALPFEKIVEDLQPERVFGRHPLFQFMFQFEERVPDRHGSDGAVFAVDVLPVDRASYWDLELSVTDLGNAEPLQCFLGVRTDLFDAAALSGWTEGLNEFARALANDPLQPLASLPLLTEQQKAERLARNATAMPLPDVSLFELFARRAELHPDATALCDDSQQCSYAELLQRALRCAGHLQAAGVAAGDYVGVCLPRGLDATVLLLAINRCGASWLALDPEYPVQRLAHMLTEVRPKLLVTDCATPLVSTADCKTISWQELRRQSAAVPPVGAFADRLCVLFTSGTTGLPKGVSLSQRAALSRCLWMWQKFGFGNAADQEVFAHRTSLSFVDSIWEIFGALIHGGCVAVAPRAAQHDMALQANWIASQNVTHAIVFPSALPLMTDCWREHLPAQLHTLIVTGEPSSAVALTELQKSLPQCRVINTYGTTENWDIAAAELRRPDETESIPAGRPVANTQVHVRDRNLQPLPDGVAGQLYVGGIGVGDGYLNRPELTAARYVTDPDDNANRLFATGDLASFAGTGELLLHGRVDRQLKLRGVRIEPGEVEALANQQPGVEQSALLLHGESSDQAWLALYAVAPGCSGDPGRAATELRDALAAALPASVVPADIVFVADIPRTPSGKIDTAALQKRLPARQRNNDQPASETERVLCDIWSQALGAAHVGRHDNFFALRGNSLLATRVTALMCDAFNLDLPLASIFESPTVAELARVVEAMTWAAQSKDDGGYDDDLGDEREVVRL